MYFIYSYIQYPRELIKMLNLAENRTKSGEILNILIPLHRHKAFQLLLVLSHFPTKSFFQLARHSRNYDKHLSPFLSLPCSIFMSPKENLSQNFNIKANFSHKKRLKNDALAKRRMNKKLISDCHKSPT